MNWHNILGKKLTGVLITAAAVAIALALLSSGIANASLKVVGHGSKMSLDPKSIPEHLKPNWEIMKKKCSRCHGLDVELETLQKGVTPSGVPYTRASIKAYGMTMLRKTDSGMNAAEVRKVLELLYFLHDEAAK
ncbi:MAG: cytochrome C [Geobacter sp.]|nr:cytochrome C [Geobacter sp.]